jgi:hypothetical protein
MTGLIATKKDQHIYDAQSIRPKHFMANTSLLTVIGDLPMHWWHLAMLTLALLLLLLPLLMTRLMHDAAMFLLL